MKTPPRGLVGPSVLAASIATTLALLPALPASAADIDKANNTDNLDLTTSWNGGVVPTSTDNAWFDTSIIGTGNNIYDFTSGLSWQQLRVDRHGAAAAGGSETIGSSNSSTLTLTASRALADVGTTTNYLTQSGVLLNSSSGASLTINNEIVIAPTSNSAALLTSSRALTLNGAVGFGANTLDIFAAGSTTNIAGVLTGSGKITKLGAGTLTLGGNNTSLTSNFAFNGGIVRAANSDNALGSGAITVVGNTTLATESGGGARNLANDITINSSRTLTTDGGYADLTLSGDIGGAGGFTKASSGNVILSGTNNYSGTTTVNSASGALQITGSTNTGAGNVTVFGVGGLIIKSGGTLTTTGILGRSTASGANITVESGGDLNVGTANISWNTSTFKVDGTMDVGSGGLNITTGATTTMSGAGAITAGSFSIGNATTVVNFTNTGSMSVAGNMTFSSSTASTFNQSAGAVNTGGLALNAPTSTYALTGGRINVGSAGIGGSGATKNINLGAGTVGARADWSSSLNMALTDASTGTTFNTLDSVDNLTARAITLSGNLTGSGSLVKNGAGTLTLSGTNAYSGSTTVNGGTLILAAGAAIADAGAVTLADAAGATLQLNASETIGSLAGGGTTGGAVNLQTNTLTAGNTGDQTFAGVITGIGGAFTKQGTGTLTLSGTNTYTGATTVNAGRLHLTGSLTSATSVSSGAAISGTGSTTGLLTMNGGSSILLAGGGSLTSLTSGDVTFAGATTVNFTTTPVATNVYDVVTYGSGAGVLTGLSNLSVFAHGTINDVAGTKVTFTADGAQTRTWDGVTGTWEQGGTGDLWQEGDQDFFNGDNVVFNEPGATATVTLSGRLAPGSITVNNSTNQYTFTGVAGVDDITGSTSLVKNNGGTLVIATPQTFTGKTTVNGGVLAIAADSGLGTAPGAAVADQLTLDGGTLRVTVGNQTLHANRGITLGSSGGTFDTDNIADTSNNTTTIAGKITGIGALTLKANGDLSATGGSSNTLGIYLSNTGNDFTGDVTIASGLVAYAHNSAFGNSANKIILNGGGLVDNNTNIALSRDIQVLGGGGTFRSYGATNVTWSGAITGTGGINRTDGGTITLSGDLSGYSGIYNNQGGTTKFTNAATALTGTLTVSAGEVSLENGVTNTYSAVNLNGGTLRVKSNNNALGSATLAVGGNATFASQSGSSALTFTNDVTIASTKTLSVDTGYASITLNGGISGAGSLTKTAGNTLTLGGTNTYTGATTVSQGTLQITGSTNTTAGNVTVGSGNAGTLVVSSTGVLTTTGTLQLGSGNTSNVFTVDAGGDVNVGGVTNAWSTAVTVNGSLDVTGLYTVAINATNVIAGSGTITAGTFTTGNNNTTVNFTNTGSMTLGTSMTVGGNLGNTPAALAFNQSAGTINTPNLILGDTSNAGSRTYSLTGGRINIGSGGITAGTGTATKNVNLGAGTVGASADWSSSLNMALTDTATGTTFNTLDSVDNSTARSVGLSGNLTGAGSLKKDGLGTLTLSGSANSYTGTTTVSGGTLELGSTGALTGTTGVTVNTGGTLLLSSASESINNAAGLTLGGGTLAYATGLSGRTETMLSLTLSANSTLDFGTGDTNQFAFTNGITGLSSFTLAVWNWTGPVGDAAQDHLAVGGSALGASELANVSFYSGAGTGFLGTGLQIPFGGPGSELVPVPEPTTALAGLALLGLAGCRRRRTQRVAAAR